MLKMIRAISTGILRQTSIRRVAMTVTVLGAALMLFLGVTFLATWLIDRPYLFLVYWFTCAWLTFTALMLALYDILILRKQEREARRELARKVFKEDDSDGIS